MSEAIEHAKEGIEHAHHAHDSNSSARWIAVLIGCLAALLALSDMGAKSSQNEYLTHHIGANDDWAFYQAKNARATMWSVGVTILESLPGATADEAIQKKIKASRDTEARLRDEPGRDGMKQLIERAKGREHMRDHAEHRYHLFEIFVGLLQICIVLASVSVVARWNPLAYAAGLIGIPAGVAGVLMLLHLM
jgi:hypothetical protein